jgi:inosose dehydratase
MTEFAERLAEEGLKLCYHHHTGTIIQSERDIDALVAHTKPPVHLLLDTGHARWGGADPVGLARAYRSRIGHVHCKDVREAEMRESNADWTQSRAPNEAGRTDCGAKKFPLKNASADQ